ncbi:WYL domain-containing protein [Glaciecola sp. SC05]|uniref:WYL domain-containing protein n=1 Tax=Glaciecola sp. SC05 TaxID=1987355 RepID=UPI0035287938
MESLNKLKINIRRRYEFIEFCLAWEGEIGRPQLQELFSISPQQATKDLTSYADAYPDNIHYDPRKRTYVVSPKFKSKLISGKASEYFMHLQMLANEFRTKDEIWIQSIPEFETVSAAPRKLSPKILKKVTEAIKKKHSLKARYLSMSSGNDNFRTLLPSAIVSDGHRWHVRAYHFEKQRYSDFVMSRLQELELISSPAEKPPKDEAWNLKVNIVLEPDEKEFDKERCAQLAYEYDMKDGMLNVRTRKAMVYYMLRHYGFNPSAPIGKTMVNKSSFSLKIKNFEEVESWLDRR